MMDTKKMILSGLVLLMLSVLSVSA